MIIVILATVLAPLLTRHDPLHIGLAGYPSGPHSTAHWLGTDLIGRDVWSRVIFGGRTSFMVGILAVGLYVAIGSFLGSLAGYFGGLLDQLIMRFTDTLMSIPSLLMIIVFVSVIGPSLGSVIIVIGLLG